MYAGACLGHHFLIRDFACLTDYLGVFTVCDSLTFGVEPIQVVACTVILAQSTSRVEHCRPLIAGHASQNPMSQGCGVGAHFPPGWQCPALA
jgi:hypothetical protein